MATLHSKAIDNITALPELNEINGQRYRLTHLILKVLFSIAPIKFNIHNYHFQGKLGDIFLFNHFTRFETFVPQYILFDREKAVCRAVAHNPLFKDKSMGDYLYSVGAVPDNLPNLTDYMAREIQFGRKVILYPEGGMIKDRKVRDKEGRLGIYKREEGGYRRKPHTGAAVIGIKTRIARDLYLMARERNNTKLIDTYRKNFPPHYDISELDELAKKPVGIVPANITFYPMRRDENFFANLVKKYYGISSKRVLEEIKIEGNILFKKTDMDIRFGEPVNVKEYLGKGYNSILRAQYLIDSGNVGTAIFMKSGINKGLNSLLGNLESVWIRKNSEQLREVYMNRIYNLTTINLGHLISHTLFSLHQKNPSGVFGVDFLRALMFIALEKLKIDKTIHLHHDLLSEKYADELLLGIEPNTERLLHQFQKSGLISFNDSDNFSISGKIDEEFSIDSIRLENPAMVLDNEANSVPHAVRTIDTLFSQCGDDIAEHISKFLTDNFIRKFETEEETYSQPKFDEINKKEKRSKSGAPFFSYLLNEQKKRPGVLLIHGFTASPSEMRVLGDYLFEAGFNCVGIRLKGHGTSPAALKDVKWHDWVKEIELGMYMLSQISSTVFVAGNSMGALLGLIGVCKSKNKAAGLVCIAPAFKLKDKLFSLISYADTARRFYEYFVPSNSGLGYVNSEPENPDINYSHMPIQGLYELYHVIKESHNYVEKVNIPTLFIQAENDPTVDSKSTYQAFEKINALDKTLLKVDKNRHVLTLDKNGKPFQEILNFLKRHEA